MDVRNNQIDKRAREKCRKTVAGAEERGTGAGKDLDVSQFSVRYKYLLWAHPAKARR